MEETLEACGPARILRRPLRAASVRPGLGQAFPARRRACAVPGTPPRWPALIEIVWPALLCPLPHPLEMGGLRAPAADGVGTGVRIPSVCHQVSRGHLASPDGVPVTAVGCGGPSNRGSQDGAMFPAWVCPALQRPHSSKGSQCYLRAATCLSGLGPRSDKPAE